jgi:hypothetical protein
MRMPAVLGDDGGYLLGFVLVHGLVSQ